MAKVPGGPTTQVSVEATQNGWIIRLPGDTQKVWVVTDVKHMLAAMEQAGVIADDGQGVG